MRDKLKAILRGLRLPCLAVALIDWERELGDNGNDDSTPVAVAVLRDLRAASPETRALVIEYLSRR